MILSSVLVQSQKLLYCQEPKFVQFPPKKFPTSGKGFRAISKVQSLHWNSEWFYVNNGWHDHVYVKRIANSNNLILQCPSTHCFGYVARNFTVLVHSCFQPKQAVILSKKPQISPLYTSHLEPNSRPTKLAAIWWTVVVHLAEIDISLIKRPKEQLLQV